MRAGIIFGLLGLLVLPPGGAEESRTARRHPVPTEAEQDEYLRLAKDVYKAEYSKSDPAGRAALVRVLTDEAIKTRTDIAGAYVLFREATDAAVKLGDAPLALRAAKEMSRVFDVDGEALKLSTLSAAARNAATAEAQAGVCEAWRGLAEEAAAEERYDAAVKHITAAEAAARNTKDAALLADVQARAKELHGLQVEAAGLSAAKKKLQDAPDDPEAALAVGKYYVASKGDWNRALPLLAKCSSAGLKEAATKELEAPKEATGKADVGDLWWAISEKETGAMKAVLQNRALMWYADAVNDLTGTRKIQVEKRMQSALSASGMTADSLRAAGLVFWVNPNLDAAGKPRELISNAQPSNAHQATTVVDAGMKVLKFGGREDVVYAASEAVKAIRSAGSAFVWMKIEQGMERHPGVFFCGCPPGPGVGRGYSSLSFFVLENKLTVVFNWPECGDPPWAAGMEGKSAFYSKQTLPYGKWGMFGCTWDGKTVSVYCNGERDNTYRFAASLIKRPSPPSVFLGNEPAGLPEYFTGMMHSAMIFNRALTDAEVRQLYVMSGIQGR